MSKIEVDAIDKQSGSTLTLGGSGTAVTLASGATQSGFGREGSVNWQTSIKTATFTAASGEGYFCNTSGGAFTVNLPSSPSVGDIVAIKDYGSSFQTNNLTIGRGGSNMNGSANDSIRNTENESLTLVYADATKGWLAVEEGTGFVGESFLVATGGAVTTSGNCKIHTFTGPGTFTVCQVSGTAADNIVSYLVVAGGGGGGAGGTPGYGRGGGGAGGFREVKTPVTPYTASPLDGYGTPTNRITVTAASFPITVGGGGAGSNPNGPTTTTGTPGVNSTFSTITSAGGGGGAGNNPPGAQSGGSGGGGSDAPFPAVPYAGGAGNTPPVSPPQGNNGGAAGGGTPTAAGGGGGGATAVGVIGGTPAAHKGGEGGAGATTNISGSPTAYAGGGGGGGDNPSGPKCTGGAAGGTGGGGMGGANYNPGGILATVGTANTGGGGGGGAWQSAPNAPSQGFAGGSGIVIIRYRFQ